MLAAVLAAAAAGGASAAQLFRLRGFLSVNMRPDVVAQTLVHVENEWLSQVNSFAECNATAAAAPEEGLDCSSAQRAFTNSCGTVAASVVHASSGDRAVVAEYMSDVCSQPVLEGRQRAYCQSFAEGLTGAMTADAYNNREHFDTSAVCDGLWMRLALSEHARGIEEAQRRVQEEAAARAAAAAKAKAEEEEAAAKAKADAEAEAAAAEKEKAEAEVAAAAAQKEAQQKKETAEGAATAPSMATSPASTLAAGSAEAEASAPSGASTAPVQLIGANSTAAKQTVPANASAGDSSSGNANATQASSALVNATGSAK